MIDLALASSRIQEQAARLLVEGFLAPRGWPNLQAAHAEVAAVLAAGFARAAVMDELRETDHFPGPASSPMEVRRDAKTHSEQLLGWVGGIPSSAYEGRVWELHPMVVRMESRRLGIGRALVAAFESEARRRGAITATLGTDDDSGMTSLAGVDLYADLPQRIAEARDLGRDHPFLFYRKLGYVITGVMPDANGPGLPDIYMSKSLRA